MRISDWSSDVCSSDLISKSCKTFTINLKHTGKLAKNIMGHNVVIAKTADMKAIDADGMKAGLASDYIKPGDARVVAHSKVIGGGESTSFTVPVAKLGVGYSFFCSFPGHSALMKGTVTLRSDEHTSDLQSLMSTSYAVLCLKKKNTIY